MKYYTTITTILIVAAFLFNTASAQNGWRKDEMEIKVIIENKQQAQQLKQLKLNGDYYPNNTARLYVTPSELNKLQVSGIDYTVIEKNLDNRQPFSASKDAYHTYQEIIDLMDSLASAFPSICQKVVVGNSVEGRELSYLKISDNAAIDETEPELIFDGGIHGDEVGAAENMVRFARELCTTYSSDTAIANRVNSREIFIYCMVNPDGRHYDSRYNANGVDLNRDWGYMWNGEGSSSGAYSQVESKALRDVMYNNQFVVHSTYHSGIEYISHPWSYRSSLSADHSHINQLAGVYANTSGYSNIPYGPGNTGMYAINGSSKDANYGINGSVSWSMEISQSKHPPASQIQYYYSINVPAMLAMIEYSGYGLNGLVTDSITGDPVSAVIFANDLFPVYTDPVGGDFHKYVLDGNYDITVKANGYTPKTITNVPAKEFGKDMIQIELAPDETNKNIYKIASCQIPDNNDADEGLTYNIIGPQDGEYYSIGKNGWVAFDMEESIQDKQGNDIIIYEGDDSEEGYTLAASENIDGPWTTIGSGTGTTEFDLANGNILQARFFKITDDGDGSANVDDAGFDLDAAERLPYSPGAYLLISNYSLTEVSGNGNGRIDAGESFDIEFTLLNNGDASAASINGALTGNSQYVTVTSASNNFGTLNTGDEGTASFSFETADDAPEATPFNLILTVDANSGAYTNSYMFGFAIGLVVEDFETGDFSAFPWEFEGDADWQIVSDNVHQGSFSAQNMDIGDSQDATLKVTLDVPIDDSISFYKKVSCEDGSSNNWDYLIFTIDGVEKGRWDGEVDWSKEQYAVSAGQHTFAWTYHKDYTVSSGSDCAWLDYIVMPAAGNNPGNLSVEVSASPLQACTGETVQLIATASGGTGSYSYNWTPGHLLNDSTIMNPIAQPQEDVTFSVLVDDGNETTNGNVDVTVFPLPDPPTIEFDGTTLSSSEPANNQWYNQDGMIEGATGQTYTPTEDGSYYATVTSDDDCESEPSNIIDVTISITELDAGKIRVYPNPSNGCLNIELNKNIIIEKVLLTSIEGVKVYENKIPTIKNGITHLDTGLKPGFYILHLQTKDELISKKITIK